MRCAVAFVFLFASVLIGPHASAADPQTDGGKIRVLLTYGEHGFDEKAFFPMLDAITEIAYTKVPLPQSADMLKPGLEKEFDVILMYDMARGLSPEQQKAFGELAQSGIGIVSWHHNLGAHSNWDEFRKIIGGKYFPAESEIEGRKYEKSAYFHSPDLKIHVADKEHPITQGLQDFAVADELYTKIYVSPEVHVLLTSDDPQKVEPEVAWTNQYGKSRVFYFMLGHGAKAWSDPNVSTILIRGIRWAAGRL